MTKSELVSQLAQRAGLTERVAKTVVDIVFDEMREFLIRGERIEIRGFGSFAVRTYDGYEGRGLKTGEIVNVHPKKLPFSKLGIPLK
jgi:integration host factor subunit beta